MKSPLPSTPGRLAARAELDCPPLLGRSLPALVGDGVLHAYEGCVPGLSGSPLPLSALVGFSAVCPCWSESSAVEDLSEALRRAEVLSRDPGAAVPSSALSPLELLRQAVLQLERTGSETFTGVPELSGLVDAARVRSLAVVDEVIDGWRAARSEVLSDLAASAVAVEVTSGVSLPDLPRWEGTTYVTRAAVMGVWEHNRDAPDVVELVAEMMGRQFLGGASGGSVAALRPSARVLVERAASRHAQLVSSRERYLVGLVRANRWQSELRGALVGTFALERDPFLDSVVLDAPAAVLAYLRSHDTWSSLGSREVVRVARSAPPVLVETAARLWEPGGAGAMGSLQLALRAARAVL